MFGILLRIAKMLVKNTTLGRGVKAIKRVGKIIKSPGKSLFRRTQAVSAVNKTVKQGRFIRRFYNIATGQRFVLDRVIKKASIIENMVDMENEMLGKRTSAVKQQSEISKVLLEGKHTSNIPKNTLKEYEKVLDNELKDLGIHNAEDIVRVIEDEEFRQDLVKTNSYEDFMENWKNGFFAYNPEDLGMSEDEREKVWEEIVSRKTGTWFDRIKL